MDDSYTSFATVYDELMDNIPYEEWAEYLISLLKEQGVADDATVADLGCGTGTVTRILDKAGYDCIGVDMSEDMLRRSRILVVCGTAVDETVLTDIAIANRFHVASSTMRGVLTVDKSKKFE